MSGCETPQQRGARMLKSAGYGPADVPSPAGYAKGGAIKAKRASGGPTPTYNTEKDDWTDRLGRTRPVGHTDDKMHTKSPDNEPKGAEVYTPDLYQGKDRDQPDRSLKRGGKVRRADGGAMPPQALKRGGRAKATTVNVIVAKGDDAAGKQQAMQQGAQMGARAVMAKLEAAHGGPPGGPPGMPPGGPPPGGPPPGAPSPMMARPPMPPGGPPMGAARGGMIKVSGYSRRKAGGSV